MSSRSRKTPLTTLVTLIVVAGLYLFGDFDATQFLNHTQADNALTDAIANQQSDVQVQASGTIVKVLPDDTKGSQHQRLLVKIPTGQVILIAHNIDLAPRVDNPKEGETIEFYGEFEWNNKGGVVHWTHHDPRGKHASGWLKYHGQTYE